MKIILSWSGGKDSMLMLHKLLQEGEREILALITTVIEGEGKIVMHEVPQALVEAQACALGFPLYTLALPRNPGNAVYEEKFGGMLERLKRRGVEGIAFGDIFLEDIRDYRQGFLQKVGVQPLFPIWKTDSHRLARDFIELGFKGITVCVDSRTLDASFAGREINEDFLQSLPAGVDPCGENGEFHSFVYDGPLFKDRVHFKKSQINQRDIFYYCDLTAQ
ncbi:MAG TPA: diphthine--ammonia ligase [Burkholderiales bacterium]|nr:diphthine--ammonia ligase [Burkholderiales bacterium]